MTDWTLRLSIYRPKSEGVGVPMSYTREPAILDYVPHRSLSLVAYISIFLFMCPNGDLGPIDAKTAFQNAWGKHWNE